MKEDSDDPAKEDLYSSVLLRAYGVVFPPIEVAIETVEEEEWTSEEAMMSATNLASSPVIDHCLHRGHEVSKKMCIPHIILDCMRQGPSESLPFDVREVILNGDKLSPKQKARLGLLRDVRERALMTLAYTSNRCYAAKYTRAVIIMFFQADGVGHANMILLERSEKNLAITLYEPNGIEAAKKYFTEKRFFAHLDQTLPSLVGCEVTFKITGLALQTYLGQRFVRKTRASITVVRRGYPICQAAVLWLFSMYVEANQPDVDLVLFETLLMQRTREDLKGSLLSWIFDLEAWVKKSYATRMSAKFGYVFRGTNVRIVDLRYGKINVLWSNAENSF